MQVERIPPGYYTPQELMERHPQVAQAFGWEAATLGQILDLELVIGFYDSNSKRNYISEQSFFLVVEHKNRLLDQSIIPLPNDDTHEK